MDTKHHPLFDKQPLISTSSSPLRRRLRRSTLVTSPFTGIFACKHCWAQMNPVDRNRRLLLCVAQKRPSWIFCTISAATILGINSSFWLQDSIHIAATKEQHTQHCAQVVQHFLSRTRHADIVKYQQALITSPCRTVFDCARSLDFTDSLPIIDAAIRNGLVTRSQLLKFCRQMRSYSGKQKAEIAISYGSGLSENGGESQARAQMILLGYVSPQQQVWFEDRVSHRNYRVDFLWKDESGETVIAEFHGKQKYTDSQMTQGQSLEEIIGAENKRESRLSLHKIRLINLDYKDIQSPENLEHELKPYNIPRRPRAKPGRVEFNPYLPKSPSLAQ